MSNVPYDHTHADAGPMRNVTVVAGPGQVITCTRCGAQEIDLAVENTTGLCYRCEEETL